MNKRAENIDLYFRGFIVKKNAIKTHVQELTIETQLMKSISNQSYQIYKGLLICNIPPINNVNKIKFEEDLLNNKYNYQYPIYFFDFIYNNEGFTFCCVPNVHVLTCLFNERKLSEFNYFKFSLKEICSNFFLLKNTPDIYLSRLNGKLQYEQEGSVKSISLYGDNILQSTIIREFLTLRSTSRTDNPFKEDPPLIDPKSCRIFCTDNSNGFSLNMDSSGNFSFYLTKIEQFLFLGKIFDFIISSDTFKLAEKAPLKRSIIALQRVEQ